MSYFLIGTIFTLWTVPLCDTPVAHFRASLLDLNKVGKYCSLLSWDLYITAQHMIGFCFIELLQLALFLGAARKFLRRILSTFCKQLADKMF